MDIEDVEFLQEFERYCNEHYFDPIAGLISQLKDQIEEDRQQFRLLQNAIADLSDNEIIYHTTTSNQLTNVDIVQFTKMENEYNNMSSQFALFFQERVEAFFVDFQQRKDNQQTTSILSLDLSSHEDQEILQAIQVERDQLIHSCELQTTLFDAANFEKEQIQKRFEQEMNDLSSDILLIEEQIELKSETPPHTTADDPPSVDPISHSHQIQIAFQDARLEKKALEAEIQRETEFKDDLISIQTHLQDAQLEKEALEAEIQRETEFKDDLISIQTHLQDDSLTKATESSLIEKDSPLFDDIHQDERSLDILTKKYQSTHFPPSKPNLQSISYLPIQAPNRSIRLKSFHGFHHSIMPFPFLVT